MISVVIAGLLLTSFAPQAPSSEQGQLDASPALFSVLAAINAAGYDAGLDSASNDPLRDSIRKQLASREIPCLEELKRFVEERRLKNWSAELSQYISFALSTSGPPDFKYRFTLNQLPPDVYRLVGFEKLMARFHREAGLDQLWRQSQPAFDRAIARYHEPVARAILEVNAYLRNVTSGYLGHRFQIYVDLLGAPNQIHVRNYEDDTFIVVTPSAEPQVDAVRHAYLQHLLDPVTRRHYEKLNEKRSLLDYAGAAPFLEETYKTDFQLLATKCLIKAIESRLAPASTRQKLVEEALREGYILTPFFAEKLPGYEAQEQSFRYHYPDMIDLLDVTIESRRLDKVQFAEQRPARKAKPAPVRPKVQTSPAQELYEQSERQYEGRQLEQAKEGYLRLLRETEEKPLQAKAYYGLARIAALQKDPELAQTLFERTLESSPEPQVEAWSHVYLARLAEASGERERAMKHYQAALAVAGATGAARAAAGKGLEMASGPEQPEGAKLK